MQASDAKPTTKPQAPSSDDERHRRIEAFLKEQRSCPAGKAAPAARPSLKPAKAHRAETSRHVLPYSMAPAPGFSREVNQVCPMTHSFPGRAGGEGGSCAATTHHPLIMRAEILDFWVGDIWRGIAVLAHAPMALALSAHTPRGAT